MDFNSFFVFPDEEKEIGFKQTWEFVPTKNKIIAELPFMGKEYTVMFEMIINKITSVYDTVLQIGVGPGAGRYGERNPSFFIKNTKELHLASSINGQNNFWKNHKLELNKWISVEVSQTLKEGKVRVTDQSNTEK